MRFFRRFSAAVALTSVLALAAGQAQAAGSCYSEQEVQAAQFRQLQTELMVAALSCTSHAELGLSNNYNLFIARFGGELKKNASMLQAWFKRQHGDANRPFDRYITALANEASIRSMQTPGFCSRMKPVFDEIVTMDPVQLRNFAASNVAPETALPPCPQRLTQR